MKKFYVDAEILQRPNLCAHIAKENIFEPGVLCSVAGHSKKKFSLSLLAAGVFGSVSTLLILNILGVI